MRQPAPGWIPALSTVVAGVLALLAGVAVLVAPPRLPADAGVPPPAGARRPSVPATASGEVPVRLAVPALGVDAPVLDALVATSGELAIPADPRFVGWWVGGAEAGAATGTLVIAGHVDNRSRLGALFRLGEARVGSVVLVRGGRHLYRYRVVARRTYPKQRLPSAIFDRAGAHRLVLITCSGVFRDGHYADNLVVYGTPIQRSGN